MIAPRPQDDNGRNSQSGRTRPRYHSQTITIRRSMITIRTAKISDADALSALAVRSKAHWGYSDDFMRACRDELMVTPEELATPDHAVAVACRGETVVGYYALIWIADDVVDLDAMFVDPAAMGHGVGRKLMDHACASARDRGARSMLIQADPYAEGFYLKMGAARTGARESDSIAGRMLPEMTLTLEQSAA